eukprot:1992704-Prymnesium_polylepis.2
MSAWHPDEHGLHATASVCTFAIFAALVVTSPATSGPLWALHSWTQPKQIHSLSIPFVNSVSHATAFARFARTPHCSARSESTLAHRGAC